MKAIIKSSEARGSVEWQDWPEPQPRARQVVVAVERAGICSTDVAIYSGTYRGRQPLRIPSMLGHEAAGTVIAIGEEVDDVAPGDRVALQVIWGRAHAQQSLLGFENLDPDWLHIGASSLGGAFAEQIAIESDRVVHLPQSVAWEDAALLEPVAVASHAMELVKIAPSETFVLIGPGPFGLLMCQMARAGGAAKVVAVGVEGIDEFRLQKAEQAGADAVVRFSGDVAATVAEIRAAVGGEGGDVVIDSGGTPESTFLALEAAAPAARVAVFGFTREARIEPLRQIIRKGLSLHGVSAAQRRHYGQALRMIATQTVRPSEIVSHHLSMRDAARGLELMASREASKVVLVK